MKGENLNNSTENPLVSIIVITYNSSKYVLETLESIKAQTYKNIELIISDDCSTDNTINICRKWLGSNKFFFINSELIQTSINTGIPSNVNRGMKKAKGEWIKLIAGDDLLLENCISDNISYVQKNQDSNFLFSKPIYIDEESKIMGATNLKEFHEDDNFYKLSARKQYLHILTQDHPINPPTLFFRKFTLDILGGFDEQFSIEDLPLYLKVTKEGHKLYFLNVNTVKYRIHHVSFSHAMRDNDEISDWHLRKLKTIISPHVNKNLFLKNPLVTIEIYNKLFFYTCVRLLGNTIKIKNNLTFIRYLSPIVILQKFKKYGG